MIYLTGVLVKVKRSGIVINAGEAQRCNIWVQLTDDTTVVEREGSRLTEGRMAKVMAIPRWRAEEGNGEGEEKRFTLTFTAVSVEVK